MLRNMYNSTTCSTLVEQTSYNCQARPIMSDKFYYKTQLLLFRDKDVFTVDFDNRTALLTAKLQVARSNLAKARYLHI